MLHGKKVTLYYFLSPFGGQYFFKFLRISWSFFNSPVWVAWTMRC